MVHAVRGGRPRWKSSLSGRRDSWAREHCNEALRFFFFELGLIRYICAFLRAHAEGSVGRRVKNQAAARRYRTNSFIRNERRKKWRNSK